MVEMLIVLLILGIITGIAVPSFLWHRKAAQDRAAQVTLKNALTAAKAEFVDPASYMGLNATEMNRVEPTVKFVNDGTASTEPYMVSVMPVNDDEWIAAARSHSGLCFAIKDQMGVGISFGVLSSGPCSAQQAMTDAVFNTEGWE